MALIDKLTAIGDGFRASRGVSDKFTLDQMATMAAEPNIDVLIERSITEVNSNAKSIAPCAFYENDNLVTVNVPAATSIGEHAFSKCSNLQTIDSSAVTSIGENAFYNCSSLTELILRNEIICELNALPANLPIRRIYVPSALINLYKTEVRWQNYSKYFRALEEYTVDGTITGPLDPEKTSQEDPIVNAVLEVSKITDDTTSLDGTKYEDEEFILLRIQTTPGGVVNVTYGNLTKTINKSQTVFFGKYNGKSDSVETPSSGTVTIEGDYISIESGGYSSGKNKTKTCECITGINSFGDISNISNMAFANCTKLTGNITIPNSVLNIGLGAFEGCTGLTSVTFDNTDGWFVVENSWSDPSSIPVDVTDPVANVTLLTDTYKDYFWKRA